MTKTIHTVLLAVLLSFTAAAQGMYQPSSDTMHPTSPRVPEYIVFAGDTIRFDTTEKYERMDRELISFTYMHSTSLLMLKRSGRYFPQLERILREQGIPDDLKYLCVIESNLDPKALSVAGAAGLWQFMKGTAKDYGMVVTTEVDERYNIEKETVAACKYFRSAYARYHDWATAMASYNCGMAGMSARLSTQKQDSSFDLWMPEETTRYVYRILAAKMLFENPAAFGYPSVERYPYDPPVSYVTISGSIESLVDFAIINGVTYAELKRANLWLRSDTLANKEKNTYRIAIPRSEAR